MNQYDEHCEELDEIAAEIREYQDNQQRSDEDGWYYADDDGESE